jgi:hypothetical protein
MSSAARATLSVAAIALAAALASCAKSPPPAAPPPAPTTMLAPQIIEQASAYRRYIARAAAISPAFTDGNAIAEGLKTGAAYEPKQLLQGAIAYGAVVALQDPTFVTGVKTYAASPETRRQVTGEILRDPAYVVGISGSASAAGLVIAALGQDGTRLYDAGKAVKQAAYDVQHQRWSKSEVPNREGRLAQAKSLSATPAVGDMEETARLQQAVLGTTALGLTPSSASPPYTPTVIRALAVAALGALGEATEANLATVNGVMVEPNISGCASMSKLNLYQCLAVAKPHYEDVFCLGQHAMMDTGRCVIRASGQTEPYEWKFVPQVRTAAESAAPAKSGKKTPSKKR